MLEKRDYKHRSNNVDQIRVKLTIETDHQSFRSGQPTQPQLYIDCAPTTNKSVDGKTKGGSACGIPIVISQIH